MIDIEFVKNSFDKYMSRYDMSNQLIYLKYHHTYRTCKQSLNICKSLNLNEEDTNLAYLIALLHDFGRFEQARVYNTFDDLKSIDHADLGCKLLFENGLIRNFIIDDSYDEIIRKAILWHNKYSIDEDLNERELMHAQIIRDADKLDIVYNITNLEQIDFKDDNSEISDYVKDAYKNKLSVKMGKNYTKNDSLLTRFAFVFDLNFNYSFKYYKENRIIEKMYSMIKEKSKFKEYIEIINEYIEGKCKNVRNKVFTQTSRRR